MKNEQLKAKITEAKQELASHIASYTLEDLFSGNEEKERKADALEGSIDKLQRSLDVRMETSRLKAMMAS